MHKIIDSLKYIKLKDLFAPFIFLLAIIPALVYKAYLAIIKKPLWLICEDGNTARDNGYYFYKYMCEKHPEVNCKYVIRKSSGAAYDKIMKLGKKPIETSSFAHYISYLAAKWNISNHKNGNPNQIFFYILHVSLGLIKNRVFLQHGITKDDAPWLYYKNTKFRYFICGAQREYEYIKKTFGYPENHVVLTGFPRFDTLIDESKNKKQILIMPTWRNWLGRETNSLYERTDFKATEYFKNWNSLLTNEKFINYIETNDIDVIFYPHINMQKFMNDFEINSKKISVANAETDIQKALRESYLMITDYSSVYMDFAYMQKPVIYFQFDYEEYRKKQYQQGYFNYEKDGFGPICKKTSDVVNALKASGNLDYTERERAFFTLRDNENCKRIYLALIGEF